MDLSHTDILFQDIDISGDPADTHSLFVVVHNRNSTQKRPKLSGRFAFEDHIRCTAAKTVFQRARDLLHHSKMTRIAKMLHLPIPDSPLAVPVADQQNQLLDATPPTLTTPTMSIPEALPTGNNHFSHISASVVQGVFRGPSPVNTSAESQEIELSSLTTPERERRHVRLGEDMPPFDTPVRLTLPAPLCDATMERGTVLFPRDLSSTPEPSSRSSVDHAYGLEDSEEALTANGGLFAYRDSSLERSVELSREGEDARVEDRDGACPLGMAIGSEGGPVLDRLDATGESVVAPRGLSHAAKEGNVAQPVVDFSLTSDVRMGVVKTGHAQEGSKLPQQDGDMLGLTSATDSGMKSTSGYSTAASTDIPSIGDVTPHCPDGDQGSERVQPYESDHEHTSTEHAQVIVTDPVLMGVSSPHASHVATDTERAQNIQHHVVMDNDFLSTEQHQADITGDTETAECLHQTQTAAEHAQWNNVNLLAGTLSAAHADVVPELAGPPLRTNSEQSVLSSKSASSVAADVSPTPDSLRILVTAETGERTPPSADDSADLLH